MNRRAIVIKEYRSSYPNPISLTKDDIAVISHCDLEWRGWVWIQLASGNAGWAPQQIFSPVSSDHVICMENYTAHELSVITNEILMVERSLNGWFWAIKGCGEAGWVPQEYVELI